MTPWSPDSASFAFTTASGAVRVQRLDAAPLADAERSALSEQLGIPALEAPAELLETPDGGAEYVVWSPC